MAAADATLKSAKEVSAMIKQGFISDSTLTFSPSRTTTLSKVPSPSNKTTIPSPPHVSPESTHPTRTIHNHQHTTLLEMMSEEQQRESILAQDSRRKSRTKLAQILAQLESYGVQCGLGPGDVRLSVVGRDGFKVSMDIHRRVLLEKSRYFAEKLGKERGISHSIEISECDDVEVYVETLVLMYCQDLKKRLIGEDVNKVLDLLKVSSAIMFDSGIMSCLEYLEAVPWSQDEEERVVSYLSQLQLHNSVTEVLQRVASEPSTSTRSNDIFLKLLTGVLQAKDEKARREMKALISRLLKEDASDLDDRLDVSKYSLYHLCHGCLSSLILSLSEATSVDESGRDRGVLMGEIAREADNLQWIFDILTEKKMGDEFVKLWADQKELAILHSKIPVMYRHEISKITAQLCVAIGRGHALVPRDTRFALLSTWLEALYEDFGWMRRASRSMDKKLVEDGLCQTILTLPLAQQQAIVLNWFDRFLNKGDDCPNIQRAFQVWWRRAFIRRYTPDQNNSRLQITVSDHPS